MSWDKDHERKTTRKQEAIVVLLMITLLGIISLIAM